MSLPIKRDELPDKIRIEDLVKIARESAGLYNKPPTKKEFFAVFKGTKVTQQPEGHFYSKKDIEDFLQKTHDEFGFTSTKGQRRLKEGFKQYREQQKEQPQKPAVKSSTPGLLTNVLTRIFGKPRTERSGNFYNPRAPAGLGSPPTEPPSSSPTPNFQKPNLPPVKLPPSVKQ